MGERRARSRLRADSSRWVRCAVELARVHRLALWRTLRPLGPVAGPASDAVCEPKLRKPSAVGVRKTAEPDVKTDTSLKREHLARVHRRISDHPKLGEKSKVQTSPSPAAKAESSSWSRTRENVLVRTKTAQDRLRWPILTIKTFSAKVCVRDYWLFRDPRFFSAESPLQTNTVLTIHPTKSYNRSILLVRDLVQTVSGQGHHRHRLPVHCNSLRLAPILPLTSFDALDRFRIVRRLQLEVFERSSASAVPHVARKGEVGVIREEFGGGEREPGEVGGEIALLGQV